MALRVLLADESTTIKKVMQLALQDFSVEVKAVHAGVDVLEVARTFEPDLIFADVLLQKKNGYEVCAALKNDRGLGKIPVVLMWSSFMDLDEGMARSCGAEARLEKPFDVETLRKLVLELVPKTRSQRLAHFLEYSPRLNEEMVEDQSSAKASTSPRPPPTSDLGSRLAARAAAGAPPPDRKGPPPPEAFIAAHTAVNLAPLPPEEPAASAAKSSWTMESFDDPSKFEDGLDDQSDDKEDFQSLELSKLSPDEAAPAEESPLSIENDTEDEAWARQDLSEFKLDLPPISVGEAGEEFKLDMGEEQFTPPPVPQKAKAPPPAAMRIKNDPAPQLGADEAHFGNDLTLDSHSINASEDEIALPLEPIDEHELEITQSGAPLESPKSSAKSSAQPPKGFEQMSAQELERVIRAQSREIIEQVVRKIVPDLAATIIREELERLLEDTAVRDTGKRL